MSRHGPAPDGRCYIAVVKTTAALLTLTFASSAALGEDAIWILAEQTPQSLLDAGAELLSADSVVWPEGGDLRLSYWRDSGDLVFRCAEMWLEGTARTSCWTRVAAEAESSRSGRTYSTRRRPVGYQAPTYYAPIYPYVWLDGWR